MYKTIYIPVDNSDHSNTAVDVGVEFAKTFGSKIVGSHVYAAKMHDKRFKQMEAGLPEEYHDEKELDRQRQIHDSLITRGTMAACRDRGEVRLEGKEYVVQDGDIINFRFAT